MLRSRKQQSGKTQTPVDHTKHLTNRENDPNKNKSDLSRLLAALVMIVGAFSLSQQFQLPFKHFASKTTTSDELLGVHINASTTTPNDELLGTNMNISTTATANDELLGAHFNASTTTPSDELLGANLGVSTITTPSDELLGDDGVLYHLIFSTDCSEFQHWQSYMLFHSAYKVHQPGTITRIASGCSDDEKAKVQQWHDEHISSVMGERFKLHLTPHFSGVQDEITGKTVGDYKFFNKPFGLRHWMEHADGDIREKEDGVVILIDPDMILLRPITGDFSNDSETKVGRRASVNRKFKVEHGSPFAQTYGLGAQWRKFNLDEIAGADSPAKKVTQQEGGTYYPVGPPYIATVRDMYQISLKWTEFVPRVHKEYPYLLAEMYAFCIAAAHLELPFQLIDSLMISSTDAPGEGWDLVDEIPHEGVCEFAKKPHHAAHPVPSLIHLCQRYFIGDWFFGKKKMAKNFFECEKPLMEEPPADVVLEIDYIRKPGHDKEEVDIKRRQREGFVVCGAIGALNEASLFYKKNHCGEDANYEYTLNLAKTFQ